jgi:hypothetical protein
MSKEALANLKPEYIVPLVAYLCHEECEENGSVFEVAGGYVAKLRWSRTEGALFDYDNFTPEEVRAKWEKLPISLKIRNSQKDNKIPLLKFQKMLKEMLN